jgi:hypothetical protein
LKSLFVRSVVGLKQMLHGFAFASSGARRRGNPASPGSSSSPDTRQADEIGAVLASDRTDIPLALLIVDARGAECAGLVAEITAELGATYHAAMHRLDVPDWELVEYPAIRELAETADRAAIVVLIGFSPARLDALFHLRAHQILGGRGAAPARCIAVLPGGDLGPARSGFVQRARFSWPFRDLVLMAPTAADADTVEVQLGLAVSIYSRSGLSSVQAGRAASLLSLARADQQVAVQIQPMWGGCGSTTAFENEIEELVGLGYFVIRIFVGQHVRRGRTLPRILPRIIAENSVHATAHIHGVAVPERPTSEQDGGGALQQFLGSVRERQAGCAMAAPLAALAALAGTAIVNHVVNLGVALRWCPRARLLLDVHDYFTRSAYDKAATERRRPGFPTRRDLQTMARAEALLWRIPDVCTTVNEGEQLRVSRFAQRSEIVLPRPYVPACVAQQSYAWDMLVVADQHDFNIRSVRWLLDVIRRDPVLRKSRVAIVGRAGNHIQPREYADLPGVTFLGFVPDLDALRAISRLSVVPDQMGTGIAIKTLTALAAGHPVATTVVGARGLLLDPRKDLAAQEDAGAFAADIRRLLTNDIELETRRQQSIAAYSRLAGGSTFSRCLAILDEPDVERTRERHALMERALALEPRRPKSTGSAAARHLHFKFGGNAQDVLRDGWHAGESWGRWMDGPTATIAVPLDASPNMSLRIVVHAMANPAGGTLAVSVNGTKLAERPVRGTMRWDIPQSLGAAGHPMQIELHSSIAYRWADHKSTPDQRVIGVGIRAIRIVRPPVLHRLRAAARRLMGHGW